MVIIIKGADYSANNLGQIEVPYTKQAETVSYLSAISTTAEALNYTKTKALDSYIKTLKNASIWGKIQHVFVPIFGRVDGSVSLKTPSYSLGLPNDSAYASYSSLGVKFAKGWLSPLQLNFKNDANGINQTFGGYNTEARPTAQGDNTSVMMSNNSSYGWLGRRISSGLYAGLLVSSALTRSQVLNRSYSAGLMLATIQGTQQSVSVDGEYVSVTQNFTGSSDRNLILGSFQADNTSAILNASLGLLFFSTALSQSEVAVVNSATNELMSKLLA